VDRSLCVDAHADVRFDDAIEVLARDPQRLLQAATDRSSDHAGTVARDLALDVGPFELARDVDIEVGEVRHVGALRSVVPLRWHARRGRAFFPTVDGRLEISARSLDPPRVLVRLTGRYDPPFGVVGDVLDRGLAPAVAASVVRRFVGEVADRLEHLIATSELTSDV
jgi:hypothetical protein